MTECTIQPQFRYEGPAPLRGVPQPRHYLGISTRGKLSYINCDDLPKRFELNISLPSSTDGRGANIAGSIHQHYVRQEDGIIIARAAHTTGGLSGGEDLAYKPTVYFSRGDGS